MPPYLSHLFSNELIDAFSSELPSEQWSELSRELNLEYVLKEQRLPRQGGALRDVYFPAGATIAVYSRAFDAQTAVAYIGSNGMTPLGDFMGGETESALCRFEVDTPGIAFSVRGDTFREIAGSSDYLRSLIAAAEHMLRFRVLADMGLARSMSCDLIGRVSKRCC